MEQKKILVSNIQRFSLHDGPGIRTTVFLKGCGLRCPWCCNPESQSAVPQEYSADGTDGVYGTFYSPDELTAECLKDRNFYHGKAGSEQWTVTCLEELDLLPGGVTFSGGEALLQMQALIPVCKALHLHGIHITVETSLFAPPDQLLQAIRHIDLFYVDVKILDAERCFCEEKGDVKTFFSNLETLIHVKDEKGFPKPIVIRIPVIGDETDDIDNKALVHSLLEKYRDRILKVELLKEHNLGERKYRSLKMEPFYHGVTDEQMDRYRNELLDLNIPVEICRVG